MTDPGNSFSVMWNPVGMSTTSASISPAASAAFASSVVANSRGAVVGTIVSVIAARLVEPV